jgi:hypothetical protein
MHILPIYHSISNYPTIVREGERASDSISNPTQNGYEGIKQRMVFGLAVVSWHMNMILPHFD